MKTFLQLAEDSSRYSIEPLPNGLIRVFDRSSKTTIMFKPDGKLHSGYLPQPPEQRQEILRLVRDYVDRPRPHRLPAIDLHRLRPSVN